MLKIDCMPEEEIYTNITLSQGTLLYSLVHYSRAEITIRVKAILDQKIGIF